MAWSGTRLQGKFSGPCDNLGAVSASLLWRWEYRGELPRLRIMGFRVGGVCAALVSLGVVGLSALPATAQGFFQQLFGFTAPPPAPVPLPAPQLTPGGRPYGFPNSTFPQRRPSGDEEDERSGGKFKTVCVRMCDGYFFPISNSTTRKGFYRDQMRCRSACGDEARLFHLPMGSTDVAEANDGNGRIYGLLNVAYRYRKTVTAGCQCRPAPWSNVEMARHQSYALAEADQQTRQKAEIAAKAAADKTIGEMAEVESVTAATAVEPVGTTAGARSRMTQIAGTQKVRPSGAVAMAARSKPAQLPVVAVQAVKPQAASGAMGLGLGGQTYGWPGDAPVRR